jgi:hypothetical protein
MVLMCLTEQVFRCLPRYASVPDCAFIHSCQRPWHRFGVNLLLYYEDGANACSLRLDPRRFGPTTDTQFGHDGYCHRPSLRTRPSCALTLFFPIGKSCPNPATAFSASARHQRDRQPKDKVSKQTSVLKRQSPCVVVKSILGSALGLLGRQICLNSPLSALPKQSPATSDILVRPHPSIHQNAVQIRLRLHRLAPYVAIPCLSLAQLRGLTSTPCFLVAIAVSAAPVPQLGEALLPREIVCARCV